MKTTDLLNFAKGGELEPDQSIIFTVRRINGALVTSNEFYCDPVTTNGKKIVCIRDQETELQSHEIKPLLESVKGKLDKLQSRPQTDIQKDKRSFNQYF